MLKNTVQKGARGTTLSPLRPSGRIVLDGTTYEARSQGHWIDCDTEIVVIDSRAGNVIVRQANENDALADPDGESLAVGEATISTPLHAPTSKVERINSVLWGTIVGCLIIPIALLSGQVVSFAIILLPLAGTCAGLIFRVFVGQAIHSVAPREDHRVRAYMIASLLLVGAAVGSCVGAVTGLGIFGISMGLVLGALAGGATSWTVILVLMLL